MTDYEELSKHRGDKSMGQFLAEIIRDKTRELKEEVLS
jgi:hypothetical protein